jgi:hypothetical protein
MHLIPSGRIRARQIKATRVVLLDCRCLRQEGVKLPIMAEDYPALPCYFADPFVVGNRLTEVELILWIVVIFN